MPRRAALLAAALAATLCGAQARADAPPALPFLAGVELDFSLVEHTGRAVTAEDYRGRPVVLFFGYVSCRSICTVALSTLAAALERLGPAADRLAPLVVTVDPEHDTPAAMARELPRYHDRLIGLTGRESDLAALRARFQVEVSLVAEDPAGAPIYAHGGNLYLIGADGGIRTVLPPILSPERMAALIRKYL